MCQLFYIYFEFTLYLLNIFLSKKIFHHRKLTEEEMCENFRKPWWLCSVGEEQKGMQTESNGNIGKAQLRLILGNLLHFSNKAIKSITEACD